MWKVKRSHLLASHRAGSFDGYIRRPYDRSPFTDISDEDDSHESFDEMKKDDPRYPIPSELCLRLTEKPPGWPSGARIVLAHLGGKQNLEANSKRAAIEIGAGLRARPPRVPGPFYLCQSPKHAHLLSTQVSDHTLCCQFQADQLICHMADIDRQGALRTVCSINELVTAYLALLTDGLTEYVGQMMVDPKISADQRSLYQVLVDQLMQPNSIGDLSPLYPSVSIRRASASAGCDSADTPIAVDESSDQLMVDGDDCVLVFRSTYITKPKDSLRIYIPSLVWPSVADMNTFHKWWKIRVEQQSIKIPHSAVQSAVASAFTAGDSKESKCEAIDHHLVGSTDREREYRLHRYARCLYTPHEVKNNHVIDFGVYTQYRLMRLPFQHAFGYERSEAFLPIRAGRRLSPTNIQSITQARLFAFGLPHTAMNDPFMKQDTIIHMPLCDHLIHMRSTDRAATVPPVVPVIAAPTIQANILHTAAIDVVKTCTSRSVHQRLRALVAAASFDMLPSDERNQFHWSVTHMDSQADADTELVAAASAVIDSEQQQYIAAASEEKGSNDTPRDMFVVTAPSSSVNDRLNELLAGAVPAKKQLSPSIARFTIMIRLTRKCAGMCGICQRSHDNENGWLLVRRNGQVIHGCHRNNSGAGRSREAKSHIASSDDRYDSSLRSADPSSAGSIDPHHLKQPQRVLGFVRSIEQRRFNDGTIMEAFDLYEAQKRYNHPTDGDQLLLEYCNRFFASVHKVSQSLYMEKYIKHAAPRHHSAAAAAEQSGDPSDDINQVCYVGRNHTSFVTSNQARMIHARPSINNTPTNKRRAAAALGLAADEPALAHLPDDDGGSTDRPQPLRRRSSIGSMGPFNVVKWWLYQSSGTQFSRQDMLPNLACVPAGVFTLYNPPIMNLGSVDASVDPTPLVNHIRHIWCNGNTLLFDYVIKWLARKVQTPWLKSKVCLVLVSQQGAGKNIITEKLHKIWGHHYIVEDDSSNVFGNFNGRLEKGVVLCLNESSWTGDQKMRGKLFALISDGPITVHQKYQAHIEMTNVIDVIVCANPPANGSGKVVPVEANDRRFLVLEINNKHVFTGDDAHDQASASYMQQLAAVPAVAFKKYLLSVDLTGFKPTRKPKTSATIRQKEANLDAWEGWLHESLDPSAACSGEHDIAVTTSVGGSTDPSRSVDPSNTANPSLAIPAIIPQQNIHIVSVPVHAAGGAVAAKTAAIFPVFPRLQARSSDGSTDPHTNLLWGEVMLKNTIYSLYFNHAAKRDNRRHTMITSVFWKRWTTVFGRPQQSQRRLPGSTNKVVYLILLPSLLDARVAFARAKGDTAADWFATAESNDPIDIGSTDRTYACAAQHVPAAAADIAIAQISPATTPIFKASADEDSSVVSSVSGSVDPHNSSSSDDDSKRSSIIVGSSTMLEYATCASTSYHP